MAQGSSTKFTGYYQKEMHTPTLDHEILSQVKTSETRQQDKAAVIPIFLAERDL